MKDEERPSLRLEAAEATLELVTGGHDGRRVVKIRAIDRRQVDIQAGAPKAARFVGAGPIEEPVEPGVEARRVPEGWQVSPGPDERLLDGVLGLIGVAEDEPGGSVQPEDRGSCKRGEGVMIASPRSFHELLLHVAPRRRPGRPTALGEYGEATMTHRSIQGPRARWRATIRSSPIRSRLAQELPVVKIQEANANSLLVAQRLPVPPWAVAHTPDEARSAAARFLADGAARVVVKAQVLVGGRGKAGGVKLAGSADD